MPGRLRIAMSEAFPGGTPGRLSPEVRDALHGTAEALRSQGHEVIERDLDFGPRDARAILGLMFRGIHDLVAEIELPQRLERRTRALARPRALISDRTAARLHAAERELAARLNGLFGEHDVLLTPTLSRPPVRARVMEGRGATITYRAAPARRARRR